MRNDRKLDGNGKVVRCPPLKRPKGPRTRPPAKMLPEAIEEYQKAIYEREEKARQELEAEYLPGQTIDGAPDSDEEHDHGDDQFGQFGGGEFNPGQDDFAGGSGGAGGFPAGQAYSVGGNGQGDVNHMGGGLGAAPDGAGQVGLAGGSMGGPADGLRFQHVMRVAGQFADRTVQLMDREADRAEAESLRRLRLGEEQREAQRQVEAARLQAGRDERIRLQKEINLEQMQVAMQLAGLAGPATGAGDRLQPTGATGQAGATFQHPFPSNNSQHAARNHQQGRATNIGQGNGGGSNSTTAAGQRTVRFAYGQGRQTRRNGQGQAMAGRGAANGRAASGADSATDPGNHGQTATGRTAIASSAAASATQFGRTESASTGPGSHGRDAAVGTATANSAAAAGPDVTRTPSRRYKTTGLQDDGRTTTALRTPGRGNPLTPSREAMTDLSNEGATQPIRRSTRKKTPKKPDDM